MTRGPWRYEKAYGHHHVLIGKECLDVQFESDARAIAAVPAMVRLMKRLSKARFHDEVLTLMAEADSILKDTKA